MSGCADSLPAGDVGSGAVRQEALYRDPAGATGGGGGAPFGRSLPRHHPEPGRPRGRLRAGQGAHRRQGARRRRLLLEPPGRCALWWVSLVGPPSLSSPLLVGKLSGGSACLPTATPCRPFSLSGPDCVWTGSAWQCLSGSCLSRRPLQRHAQTHRMSN